ncbi:hypothetical protein VTL71DRAFT_11442 [Oculimacula yallundae]|uniref:AB hydrolase-1 domain-containing protein n=1 Tax=Oculimacula yallundae TaxID=86028 RepID=A0ABR4CQ74_9HELO
MSTAKPTLIFVTGAWHSPRCWTKVVSLLTAHGYKTLTPALPSTLGSASATFADDLDTIRSSILSETTEGSDVVVVAWSYGSLPGASAIKGLARPKADREEEGGKEGEEEGKGRRGYVIGLALMATGFCATGMSFLAGTGGSPPPFWSASSSGFAEFTISGPALREFFYHDLPVEEGEEWVDALTKHSLNSLSEGGELVYAGWKDVPVWFLGTKEDVGLPFEVQKGLVEAARSEGGDVVMREVDSGHSPMLSKPEETVEFLEEAVKAFMA